MIDMNNVFSGTTVGETEPTVSVSDTCPVRTGSLLLFCCGDHADKAKALTNESRRSPDAEGSCSFCGAWIGDPFARCDYGD